MEVLRQTLESLWDADTAFEGRWSAERSSTGQCAVTALLVQDLLGGTLHRIRVADQSHYFSVIDGVSVDLTADQFDEELGLAGSEEVERDHVLAHPDTARRYALLKARFDAIADKVLPVQEQEHLAIRDPNYVAGTSDRPEVAIFSQSRTDRVPLPDRRMAPGQRVWMKWVGGPIVACSAVQSWHTVRYEDGNVNEARGLSLGTRLFGLNDYWTQVQDKGAGWVSVVRLRDERWLDAPIYGAARSRGSSWLYLDTIRKKVLWLSQAWEPERSEADAGRSIPAGLRFRVLRRDNYTCRYCGATAPEVPLHVDHVVPWVEVRCHEVRNLVTACQDCNLGKSSKPLTPQQVAQIHAENERRA
jgi:hypothetical protein